MIMREFRNAPWAVHDQVRRTGTWEEANWEASIEYHPVETERPVASCINPTTIHRIVQFITELELNSVCLN